MPLFDLDRRLPTGSRFADQARRGNLNWEELPKMERTAQQEELKAHLMATSQEFSRLAAQHLEYAHRLDELETHLHLTYEEELEETRLKKLKLRVKDQMEALMMEYKAQHV